MAAVTLDAFETDRRRRWVVQHGVSSFPRPKVAGTVKVLRHEDEYVARDLLWHVVRDALAPLEIVYREGSWPRSLRAQSIEHAAQCAVVDMRIHAYPASAWQHNLDQPFGTRCSHRRHLCLWFGCRRGRRLRHHGRLQLPLSGNSCTLAKPVGARAGCRSTRRVNCWREAYSCPDVIPCLWMISLGRTPGPRLSATISRFSSILDRPSPATLTTRNHLDPLRRSHMTTLETAPYRTVPLDRRLFADHAEPSAHDTHSTQGRISIPLPMHWPIGIVS
jgi:hypothetical protein